MQKTSFIILIAGILCFSACKEKGAIINTGTQHYAIDTVYMGTVETAQPHNILIEEFTGASCTNCPRAQEALDNLSKQAQYEDRLVEISLHFDGGPLTHPVKGAANDFRNKTATDISNLIYLGVSALPTAGVDRMLQNNTILLNESEWPGVIANQIATPAPVNLNVQSTYSGTTGIATIKVRVSYTQTDTQAVALSLTMVEDNIIDYQKYPDHTDSAYLFKNIFRDMLTNYSGVPILDTIQQKQPGLTLDRTYTYDLSKHPGWKPENCRIVAFVHKTGNNKEVLQTVTAKIKP